MLPGLPPHPTLRHPWAPEEVRKLSLGRQGAGGSSWPSASVPRCPPRGHQPLTDFHSPVVQAPDGGVQGVQTTVQLGGAVTQRGRLALELPENVPSAARQVGQLGEQADQGVRADLLQRAEERRVPSPSRRRLLWPAQPCGLHAPLVEGHGWARGVPADRRSRASRRAPRAMGAGPHPTQRRVPGQLPRGRDRAARRRRDGSETLGGGPRGSVPPPGLWSSAAEEVPGAAPGRPRRVPLKFCRQESAWAPSLPPDWRGRRKRGKCRRHGREGGRREKGKGEEKGRLGTTCGSRARRAQRPGRWPPGAPAHPAGAAEQSPSSGSPPTPPAEPPGAGAHSRPAPQARVGRNAGASDCGANRESGSSPARPRWRLSPGPAFPGKPGGLSEAPWSLPCKALKTSGVTTVLQEFFLVSP